MAYCEFGRYLDEALQDKPVCGLRQENTQKQLLTDRDLKFKVVCHTAQAMELMAKNTLELAWKTLTSVAAIHNVVQGLRAPTYQEKRASETQSEQSYNTAKQNAIVVAVPTICSHVHSRKQSDMHVGK